VYQPCPIGITVKWVQAAQQDQWKEWMGKQCAKRGERRRSGMQEAGHSWIQELG
jgi:hypothetical protein